MLTLPNVTPVGLADAVGMATCYGLEGRSNPGRGEIFSIRPDRP